MKKNLTILIAVIITAAGWVYGISHPNRSSAQALPPPAAPGANNLTQNNPVLPASSLPDYLATASQVFGANPTGAILPLGTSQGTVSINNFYASDPPVDDSQYIVIKLTQNYLIDYDPTDSSFWIGVSGMPFSAWQSPAEQDFLATLGVSKSDACKLTVVEGVIYNASNSDDGKSFPLSFCGAVAQ